MNKRIYLLLLTLALGLEPLGAMHIMEGFIPLEVVHHLVSHSSPLCGLQLSLCSPPDQDYSSP